mmetsp:Transcript_54389/g.142151  ORF Transcript_54389/g.142151 Transcript_54389/m.142151 type:complete len:218 (+) Transcript_54389:61-714(+)
MILQQQVEFIVSSDLEHFRQALVDEHVLAPEAISRAQPREVGHALLAPCLPSLDGGPREDLEGTVEAHPAVVQIHALRVRGCVVREEPPEPLREEHAIRVNFDDPVVASEAALLDDLVPNGKEYFRVQSRLELTAIGALQVTIDLARQKPFGDGHHLAAVYRVLLASEDARPLLILHLYEARLVARGLHQLVAIQRTRWESVRERRGRRQRRLRRLR